MDKTALVENDIEVGRQVTKALDDARIAVKASFWFYEPGASEWRLIIATPLVDRKGPRAAYAAIQRALRDIEFPLRKVSVVGPRHSLIKLLRIALRTGGGISGIRFTHNTINNVFIEDAYIYRLV